MAVTIGTVKNVKFGDDYGFFTVDEAAGGIEIFILWFGERVSGGPVALYTMLVTVAAARKLTVEVSHDDASAFVNQVLMRGQP